MGKELVKLCREIGIPLRALTPEEFEYYRNNRPDPDKMFSNLLDLNYILEENLILIGGFCLHPSLLGHRTIRRISNDLDCITNEKGIRILHKTFGDRLFNTLNYKDVFLDYDTIPCGFDIKDTHGWNIPEDFYTTTKKFNFKDNSLSTISPEYLIALKARRSKLKNRIYGKDKLDTISLIIAPYFKHDLNKVDLSKASKLIKEHSTMNYSQSKNYVNSLRDGFFQLDKMEKSIFLKEHSNFLKSLEEEYTI